MSSTHAVVADAESAFRNRLAHWGMRPLWDVLHALVPKEPSTAIVPARWRYADVEPCLTEAGRLISAEKAERRVLILENPALPGQSRITSTLYAGLQLILPGEIARCHRHSQCALRFIMEGDGAHTAVDGERVVMRRWDLILTPAWRWHDHGNETNERMVWLDGLDIPLVAALDAGFAEGFSEGVAHPATRPAGDSLARYGSNMRPARQPIQSFGPQGLMSYPYARWRPALDAMMAAGRPDAHDAYRLEFVDPASGQSIMNTISAFVQLIPAGFTTAPVRSTDGAVYVVVSGSGDIQIGNESWQVAESDIFVVPAWAQRRITAAKDLVLFNFSDKAAQQRLGLWREHLG